MAQRPAQGRQRLSSAQISAAVAVIALCATLFYNTYSMRTQAREAKQTRIAAEVTLLTSLNSELADVEEEINGSKIPDYFEEPANRRGLRSLPRRDEVILLTALDFYDWIAWLFNNGLVTYEPALRYWEPALLTGRKFGHRFYGMEEFPDLDRFSRERGRSR
jgi:hypothetical protein